ncbi:MAG: phosphatase PAP2 family protein [Firmicutes bacterium]|nr:phosphatase PAP2 family protein [Bacillota bacterium]
MKKQNSKTIYLGLSAGFALLAALITYLVGANDTLPLGIDLTLQQAFINMRVDILTPFMKVVTHSTDTITIVILCAVLVLVPMTRLKVGLPLTAAALINMGIYKAMKHIFLRARPDVVYHLVEQGGYAFPSGHSATSMLVYGLLFYLIGKYCNNQKLKVLLQAICGILVLTVGPSRLYVGVHWATDVMAGWCVGAAVLMATVYIIERFGKKNESI